ncbi:hypothetical protein Tco_0577503 [Tanacetum coccineum]
MNRSTPPVCHDILHSQHLQKLLVQSRESSDITTDHVNGSFLVSKDPLYSSMGDFSRLSWYRAQYKQLIYVRLKKDATESEAAFEISVVEGEPLAFSGCHGGQQETLKELSRTTGGGTLGGSGLLLVQNAASPP